MTLLPLPAARRDLPEAQDHGRRARARAVARAAAGMGRDRLGHRVRDLDADVAGGPDVPSPSRSSACSRCSAPARLARRARRLAFAASAVAIAACVGSIFIDLYPNVMVSSTNAAYNLTVNNSASGSYALKVMTIVARVFLPARAALPGLVLPRVPRSRRWRSRGAAARDPAGLGGGRPGQRLARPGRADVPRACKRPLERSQHYRGTLATRHVTNVPQ